MDVALQLAPAAAASSEVRSTVGRAFARAGVDEIVWIALTGDKSQEVGTAGVAPASLTVRLRRPFQTSDDHVSAFMDLRVGPALSDLRGRLPSLPLGIELLDEVGMRRFAIAPTDTAGEVLEGLRAFAQALALSSSVVGWMASSHRWVEL